jgi:pyrimidine operon attenuation protein / uracil phosphoribosyltransferase
MTKLPDVSSLIAELARAIGTPPPGTVLVGIHTGGVWVAEKLAAALPVKLPMGTLAITLHRDDYDRRGIARNANNGHSVAGSTRMPMDITERHVLLVDDVIASGRTVRAAMNELFDFGRPASVKFACLADRGGRELPVMPDYCALKLDVPPGEEVVLGKDGDRLTLQFNMK